MATLNIIIDICPTCKKEVSVISGSFCGFDGVVEGIINVECPYCKNNFKSGENYIKNKKVFNIDTIEYDKLSEKIFEIIKNENDKTVYEKIDLYFQKLNEITINYKK